MRRSKVLLETFFDIKIPINCSLLSVSGMNPKFYPARSMSLKKYLDYSKVPKLDEADVEIQFVRGSGPGGQATNKTNNAVVVKHLPTGIVVKNHSTRSMWDNKKKAMETLVSRLDNLINGEESIEAQTKNYQAKKSAEKDRKRKKLEELKAAFKEREGL